MTVKGIATHSWGLTRVHVNAAATLSPDGASPVAEPPPEWWAGIAVDRTLFRQSLRFVAETVVLHPEGGAASIELNVGGGLRWQWTPTTVVDVGLGRRLRSMGPDISVTLGLTKTFGHSFLRPSRR